MFGYEIFKNPDSHKIFFENALLKHLLLGSSKNWWCVSHLSWNDYYVAVLQKSSSKSKLLKPGGQFQDHDVLKGLCNGAHCMLLTFASKITFLEIQGAPTSTLI